MIIHSYFENDVPVTSQSLLRLIIHHKLYPRNSPHLGIFVNNFYSLPDTQQIAAIILFIIAQSQIVLYNSLYLIIETGNSSEMICFIRNKCVKNLFHTGGRIDPLNHPNNGGIL